MLVAGRLESSPGRLLGQAEGGRHRKYKHCTTDEDISDKKFTSDISDRDYPEAGQVQIVEPILTSQCKFHEKAKAKKKIEKKIVFLL